VETTAEISISS